MLRTLVFLLVAAAALTAQHRPIVRLNNGGFNPNTNNVQEGIRIANAGPKFVAVFAEQNGVSSAVHDVYAAVSDDDGLTWNAMTRVDLGDAPNSADSDEPKVGICADGTVVVVWEEKRDALANASTNEDVFFNRSTDGGVTWGAVSIPLNTATAGSHVISDVDRVQMAVSGNTVHVIWEEDGFGDNFGSEQVFYVRSTDSGATWSAPVMISTQAVMSTNPTTLVNEYSDVDDPAIAADGLNVAVCFVDDRFTPPARNDDAVVLASQDGGLTWVESLVDANPTGDVDSPAVVVENGVIVAMWRDEGAVPGGVVTTASSFDGGLSFGPETVVSTNVTAAPAGQEVEYLSLDLVGLTAYATWVDDHLNPGLGSGSAGERKAYVATSYDGGLSWGAAIGLDFGAGNAARKNHFTAVKANSRVAYVWYELWNFGSNDNAYAYSLDQGQTWTSVEVPALGDTDSPDVLEGDFFAISPVSHTAVGVFHNNPLGQNEVFALGFRAPRLVATGTPFLGSAFGFGVRSAFAPGFPFLVGLSGTGAAPATDLGGGLLLHLALDPLTFYVLGDPSLAPFTTGVTGANGDADCAAFPWPFGPGVTLYATALFVDPFLGVIAGAADPVAVTSL
jgi:hypothetical protein